MTTTPELKHSSFKGVSYDPTRGIWRAHVRGGRRPWSKSFPGTPEGEVRAALAYDRRATEMFGEIAQLNFPATTKD
jgi:hypothetical protein